MNTIGTTNLLLDTSFRLHATRMIGFAALQWSADRLEGFLMMDLRLKSIAAAPMERKMPVQCSMEQLAGQQRHSVTRGSLHIRAKASLEQASKHQTGYAMERLEEHTGLVKGTSKPKCSLTK